MHFHLINIVRSLKKRERGKEHFMLFYHKIIATRCKGTIRLEIMSPLNLYKNKIALGVISVLKQGKTVKFSVLTTNFDS